MLYRLRKSRNLSREQLARLSGVDSRTIFRIEKGQCIPLLDTYVKIIFALDLTKDEVFESLINIAKENNIIIEKSNV